MTNRELLGKIRSDIDNEYYIGLHNLNIDSYCFKLKYDLDKYYINLDMINEDMIVSSILNRGLIVPNRYMGLCSTVRFFKNIDEDIFNYIYGDVLGDKYVLIILIPKYIYINGYKYLLRDLVDNNHMVNYSLFDSLLPKEFIYGYYVRNVNFNNGFIFSKDLEFYSNNDFYGYMDRYQQEEFWINYLRDNGIDINMINNKKYLSRLFNGGNKYTIKRKILFNK